MRGDRYARGRAERQRVGEIAAALGPVRARPGRTGEGADGGHRAVAGRRPGPQPHGRLARSRVHGGHGAPALRSRSRPARASRGSRRTLPRRAPTAPGCSPRPSISPTSRTRRRWTPSGASGIGEPGNWPPAGLRAGRPRARAPSSRSPSSPHGPDRACGKRGGYPSARIRPEKDDRPARASNRIRRRAGGVRPRARRHRDRAIQSSRNRLERTNSPKSPRSLTATWRALSSDHP